MDRDVHDPEWLVRKRRIDPVLDGLGWSRQTSLPAAGAARIEEYETVNGPADYALGVDGTILGVVEAKKLTLGPQNVLTQAERYSKGATSNPLNFEGYHVPFLYSTNGEVIWFRHARHSLNRSRRVFAFHNPAAFKEMMTRDLEAELRKLRALPNTHKQLRPYQIEANAAIEKAIADRKHAMLVAMATGTGKTFTLTNQVYRLMKSGVARRVLFLVDRRALAAQAVRAFKSFEPERFRRQTGRPVDRRERRRRARVARKGEGPQMEIRYNRDADTGLPHIYTHGLRETEVEDVLNHRLENRPGRKDSRVIIGRTRAGRVLKVIAVPDKDGRGIFVIAYDLTGKALAAFRRRLRKRGLR